MLDSYIYWPAIYWPAGIIVGLFFCNLYKSIFAKKPDRYTSG